MSTNTFIRDILQPKHQRTSSTVVYGSDRMKSYLQSIKIPTPSFETISTDALETGLESQQLDANLSEKVNQALMERIHQLQVPTSYNPAGLNYFVINPDGLEEESEAEVQTLMALARASLYDPQRVIAAFIPVLSPHAPSRSSQVDGYDTVAAIGHHLTEYLAERGVLVLEGLDSLKQHLELNG